MFLEGKDRFSVITLAGAASTILTRLVINAGKQPFADYGRLIVKEYTGIEPKRDKYIRHVNMLFGIDFLKHQAPNDPTAIDMDEDRAAENAVIRAMMDYIELCGQDAPFVKAFLQYTWLTRNGPELMKAYKEQPDRIKQLGKRR